MSEYQMCFTWMIGYQTVISKKELLVLDKVDESESNIMSEKARSEKKRESVCAIMQFHYIKV